MADGRQQGLVGLDFARTAYVAAIPALFESRQLTS
jgi:hypothetical protein